MLIVQNVLWTYDEDTMVCMVYELAARGVHYVAIEFPSLSVKIFGVPQ